MAGAMPDDAMPKSRNLRSLEALAEAEPDNASPELRAIWEGEAAFA